MTYLIWDGIPQDDLRLTRGGGGGGGGGGGVLSHVYVSLFDKVFLLDRVTCSSEINYRRVAAGKG